MRCGVSRLVKRKFPFEFPDGNHTDKKAIIQDEDIISLMNSKLNIFIFFVKLNSNYLVFSIFVSKAATGVSAPGGTT